MKFERHSFTFLVLLTLPLWVDGFTAPRTAHGEDPIAHGAVVYRKLCLECHGDKGQGVEDKAKPLRGNRDLDSLAGRIERTMPEDNEDACIGADARAAAAYIYHTFYSADDRARQAAARVELVRLTVPQFRTSVADLVGGFYGGYGKEIRPERGLTGRYFGTRGFGGQKEKEGRDKYEQRDAGVRFDFGVNPPSPPEAKELPADEFSIRWEGVLLPDQTGEYEFVIRTRNGVLLWVNDRGTEGKQLIDGWVAPDNEIRELKEKVYLLGGRAYPLRLDFFKYKEAKGAVELLWKPPYGVLETIPERHLAPDETHETLVVDTPFPADDRSVGYERGTSVSKEWFEAAISGATEAASYVVSHLDKLAGTKAGDPERSDKIKTFAAQLAERALRRPLTEAERQHRVDAFFQTSSTPETAVKRVVLLALTSPDFLYPALPREHSDASWQTAQRLALALWDSVPDLRLLEAARKGELITAKQIENQARRMLSHARTKAKLRGFFEQWLELERSHDLSKDSKAFPDFDDALLADLRTSLDLFLDEVVWSEASDYRQLLLADYLYLNPRLAALYGDGQKLSGAGFQRVIFDPRKRSGVITHPFLLTAFAYHNNTSPIHRGVFLTRNIVGMSLNPPPKATKFEDSKFDPHLTMREKVTEMTRSSACMACHTTINPLGFSLEQFDGIGRWRTQDKDKPVDPASDFKTDEGDTLQIKGARDVAEFAAESPSAHRAFLQQLFHHCLKQPAQAYGPGTLATLESSFERSQFSIRELLVTIAVTGAQPPPPAPTSTTSNP